MACHLGPHGSVWPMTTWTRWTTGRMETTMSSTTSTWAIWRTMWSWWMATHWTPTASFSWREVARNTRDELWVGGNGCGGSGEPDHGPVSCYSHFLKWWNTKRMPTATAEGLRNPQRNNIVLKLYKWCLFADILKYHQGYINRLSNIAVQRFRQILPVSRKAQDPTSWSTPEEIQPPYNLTNLNAETLSASGEGQCNGLLTCHIFGFAAILLIQPE